MFALYATLLFLRRRPALLALPAMAASIAILAGDALSVWLSSVMADRCVVLAPAYVAVSAGAMLGRLMMTPVVHAAPSGRSGPAHA